MNNNILNKIHIENYYCIKDVTIENLSDKNEIYFLGENGVGKTILLQFIIQKLNEISIKEKSLFNVFAYGTARFRTGSATDDFFDKTGFDTLFDRNKLLINPIQWFKDVLLRETQNESPLKIDSVLRTFEEIIDFDNSKSFRIERNGSKFTFYEQNTQIEFEHLAEGYRSVLIWLCDLLSRLTEIQPDIEKLDDFCGIVLVDEVDLFLHPKWEYSIVRKLRQKLPNIQWLFTTHSPMLILGASEDAVFYRLYKERGETQISEQWNCGEISNLMASAIITSPLFDMETARMSSFDNKTSKLDTSDYFLESLIGKKVAELVAEKRKGKNYISRKETDAIIDEAIKKLTVQSI